MNLIRKKTHFRENWLICWGIWGEAELILGFWEQRQNTFRELRNFHSGIQGDQYIISMDQRSTNNMVVGKGELFFYEVIPLSFKKL